MKHRKYWLIGAIALLCAIGFGISGQTKAVETERWEYLTVYGHPSQSSLLNAQGSVGWELAAASCPDNNQCAYFLKRRK
jgi:hypothetical protein